MPDDTVDPFAATLASIDTPVTGSLRASDTIDALSQIVRDPQALNVARASLKER